MDKLDRILDQFIAFVDAHPDYTLLVASSMGQAAIPAEKTFSFLTIADVPKFMSQLGVPPGSWEVKPAMVPCVCVVVRDGFRDRVISELASLAIGGATMKRDKRPLAPMSFDERERGFFHFYIQFDNYDGPTHAQLGGRTLALGDLGLGSMAHEDGVNCTAQHIPEGCLIVYRARSRPAGRTREMVSTVDIAPSVLKFFGFERPSYMRGNSTLLE
jgi:hypothetical protein